MRPSAISVFLLSFLLPLASALSCYQCRANNSDTCVQDVDECPEGDQCLTISEHLLNNQSFHSIYKGCSHNLPCNVTAYGKPNNEAHLKYNIQCCSEDLCNAKFYEMPKDEEPSGDLCPSCFKPDTVEGCEAVGMIRCQSKTDKCQKLSTVVANPDGNVLNYSLQGCITDFLCDLDLGQLVGVKALKVTKFECSDIPTQPPCEEEKDKK